MYKTYKNDVEFFIVYIREAHPNQQYPQPTTFEQRVGIADSMCTQLDISIPTLIDNIDNKVGEMYQGWPDRLYLVGRNGTIAFKGARGPFGFKPEELEDAIRKEIREPGGSGRSSGGSSGVSSGGRRLASPDAIFKTFDKNSDGKLTQDEIPKFMRSRIMPADADGDGTVTKAELEKARANRGGGRSGGERRPGGSGPQNRTNQ